MFSKLGKLRLVPEQQCVVDNGLQAELWQLPHDQQSQPHNELIRRLQRTVAAQRQSSVLLLAALDQVFLHNFIQAEVCLLYTSPSPRDGLLSRMPSSA